MLDGVTARQFKAVPPGSETCVQPGSPRLLDQVREAIRLRHYSMRVFFISRSHDLPISRTHELTERFRPVS